MKPLSKKRSGTARNRVLEKTVPPLEPEETLALAAPSSMLLAQILEETI
jgi:hypothetical protein